MNREDWLTASTEILRGFIAGVGVTVPEVYVSVGFPKGHGGRRRAIGQCWDGSLSKDGKPHVFICPTQGDSIAVLGILAHELIHAGLPIEVQHKGPFAKAAAKLGLVKPWTATTVGDALKPRLQAIVDELGAYPHAVLIVKEKQKKGSRLRLFECRCEEPVKVRVARDDFDATCNVCGECFERKDGE